MGSRPFTLIVSIRSPHQSKGRPVKGMAHYKNKLCFNPLPSPKQGETLRVCLANRRRGVFQSAPLTKARGDLTISEKAKAIGRVSIRSPHQSKGRPYKVRYTTYDMSVSIRSPHQSKGRPGLVRLDNRVIAVSIRSPHQSKGRPTDNGQRQAVLAVSIRSPHQSKGRRPSRYAVELGFVVSIRSPHQSKGRPRNDGNNASPAKGFNPLPSPKQGETRAAKA